MLFTWKKWAFAFLSPFFIGSYCIGQQQAPPKLVVGIVVDQMRPDYIYRYWDKFGENGFKRLVNEGFVCKNTNYNYVPTYTAPGHASIYTGTTPAVNGIAGNNWYSRDSSRIVYCTEDLSVQTIGSTSKAGLMSPRNLLSTTITDELRIFSNKQSKVIGISLKDRGSILPAGHLANAAYWFDSFNGHWITSSYYMQALPKWVNDFNKQGLASKYLSQPWKPLLPLSQYTESLPDDNPYEGLFKGESKPVFPHNLPQIYKQEGFEAIRSTPSGNTITKDFALAAIQAEQLGKGKHTDFLAVSFSSSDYIGHRYGPGSVEVEDMYLRLDQDIAQLLDFVEKSIGKENALVFLTSDHGAAEVPAYLMDNKVPSGYLDGNKTSDLLAQFIHKNFGDSLFVSFYNQQVYLNREIMERKKINPVAVQEQIARFSLSLEGVASAVTTASLYYNGFTDPFRSLVQNGNHATRSGDVFITLRPGWYASEFRTGTTHGSTYSYDTRVPLIWYGWKIPKGSSAEAVHVSDIAPTLAIFLNTPFPNGCTGKPIVPLTH